MSVQDVQHDPYLDCSTLIVVYENSGRAYKQRHMRTERSSGTPIVTLLVTLIIICNKQIDLDID